MSADSASSREWPVRVKTGPPEPRCAGPSGGQGRGPGSLRLCGTHQAPAQLEGSQGLDAAESWGGQGDERGRLRTQGGRWGKRGLSRDGCSEKATRSQRLVFPKLTSVLILLFSLERFGISHGAWVPVGSEPCSSAGGVRA